MPPSLARRTQCSNRTQIIGPGNLNNIVRLQFAYMPPAISSIKTHRDTGGYALKAHRIHIPIFSNPKVTFEASGKRLSRILVVRRHLLDPSCYPPLPPSSFCWPHRWCCLPVTSPLPPASGAPPSAQLSFPFPLVHYASLLLSPDPPSSPPLLPSPTLRYARYWTSAARLSEER